MMDSDSYSISSDPRVDSRAPVRDGQDHLAADVLQAAVDANPDDGQAWELLGIEQYAQQLVPLAQANLEMATALKPLSIEGQLTLANCYTDQGFRESARAIYIYLSETLPLTTRQIPEVVRGLASLGEFRRALMLCREVVRRDPECDQALYGMAYYMAKCGAPDEVIVSVLHRVVELAPDVVLYRVALATLHQKLGHIATATQVLAPFAPEHLRALKCPGCVRKIARLFEAAGDELRHAACLARIEELKPL